ncbi:MAG: PspC domain-containing protein [Actinomycetota bacterium]|nr:PspC domain-containing protein [Actinomycetota bacterium]
MSVEETARDFWATRPRRRADDRKVAGVAAAVGRRYGIDPVLVRVGFVVATVFSGVGVLLYLLGWLLLPTEGDDVCAAEAALGKGRSSVSTPLTLILGLALIPAAGVVFGGDPRGLIVLALCGTALFVLHRYRASAGEVPATSPMTAATAPGTPAAASTTTANTGLEATPADPPQTSPPGWDPLGAAPFAWDLPDPRPAPPVPPPPPRPRSKVTPITLGLALLAAGVAAAFLPAISPAQVAAVALGVIGLGLVTGSVLRGGRGLIAVAVPLALVTWLLHSVPLTDAGAGERRWSATTPTQLQDRYAHTAGSGHLDLTDLVVPDGRTVSTTVAVSLGEAKVFLPPDLDVEVACRVATGEVSCLSERSSGFSAQAEVDDAGADGPGGGRLVLDVRTGIGNVEVTRRG